MMFIIAQSASASVIQSLWEATFLASCLFLIVCIFLGVARHRVPSRWQSALYLLVLVRLAIPVTPESPWQLLAPAQWLPTAQESAVDGGPTSLHASSALPVATEPVAINSAPVTPQSVHTTDTGSLPENLTWSALLCLWLIGVAAVLALQLIRWRRVRIRLVVPTGEQADRCLPLMGHAQGRVGLRSTPSLMICDVGSAFVCGLRRPMVVVSKSLLDALDDTELKMVFMHEMTHLKRRDLWINALCTIVVAAHWFNPVAWLLRRRIDATRELVCDRAVLDGADSTERGRYGHTLIRIVEMLQDQSPDIARIAMASSYHSLERRLKMIARKQKTNRHARTACILLAATLLLAGFTRAQSDDASKPNASKGTAEPTVETIVVDSTDRLLLALEAPVKHRTIVLKPGRYVLKKPLVIKKARRLTLRGEPGKVTIEVDQAHEPVAHFVDSKNIRVEGLTLGHTRKAFETYGACTGEVLRLDGCVNAVIDRCDLYGCGQQGLLLHGCRDLRVIRSRIHDCNGMLFTAVDCTGLRFETCRFDRNKLSIYGILLRHCPGTVFQDCRIADNTAGDGRWISSFFTFADRDLGGAAGILAHLNRSYESKKPQLTTVALMNTVCVVPKGFTFSSHANVVAEGEKTASVANGR